LKVLSIVGVRPHGAQAGAMLVGIARPLEETA
jgi:hypothetical protein